ncbi:uncharacterized protein LOC117574828 [Drosophila albomicans]|uniref:Uncharacterized protein LOC117574828 n=1 Tax=Drosophila albomicans TaxID=7291 RepID=A0A6P8XEF4_DROAB|nr:uncharacterized protein LOC117574828 [Drosophila albomicans]
MKRLTILLAFVLCAAKGIKNSQQSIDDLNYAIEITTRSTQYSQLPGPVKLGRTVGRTRQTLIQPRNLPEPESSGNKTEMYCCFWLYPDHPALPDEWEHRDEYPFDFHFNGKFVKNERNHKDE